MITNKIIVLLLMILNSYCVFSQPKMVFRRTQYNFRIVSKDSVSRISFDFFNNGNDTLEISKIYTSCHCTKVRLNKMRIAPGEPGNVYVELKPMNIGRFKEKIILCIKRSKKPLFLNIKGKVI